MRHGLGESSRKAMLVYHWPGNVRELQNIIERALILNVNGHLDVASLLQVQPQREVKPQAGMQGVLTDKAMRDLGKKNILTHLNLPIGKFLAVAVQQNCYKFHPLHAVQESASLE